MAGFTYAVLAAIRAIAGPAGALLLMKNYTGDRLKPHVPFRQWTRFFSRRVRWVLLKGAGLLFDVRSGVLLKLAQPMPTRLSSQPGP